ncbi:hypothetical protein GH5_06205 [Leishmania sp. Ghana 2012 LV757]|uniref:hypothetical protein n=1 Tax=Leishmania sp. Ghana 2012 LV757 TaxID=2803181 RepID=UPI001B4C32B2|nr:hypothetical protein GH5_06205 [Leishmania sp. Ghana 2012 LV757]
MHLLVDGDYLLSGFRPSSEEEVKAAVERLMTAIEQQLLQPVGADSAATTLVSRIIFFSSALIKGLEEGPRTCVISTLRRLRFQTHVLESIHGRVGTPVDSALCTKLLQLSLLPAGGSGVSGGGSAVASHGPAKPAFCLVTPNAYLSTAMELMASRESGEVVFTVYEGDEVAEELLGYASARYGATGGVATMEKHDGVAFLPSTEAAVAALTLVVQQEQSNLSISALAELKALQVRLQQQKSVTGTGATVAMPTAPTAAPAAQPPIPAVPDLFTPPNGQQPTAPPPSSTSRCSNSAPSSGTDAGSQLMLPLAAPPVPAAVKPLGQVSVPAPPPTDSTAAAPSFFETGSLHTVTTATSPPAVVQHASPPSPMPPPPSTSPLSAVNGAAGATASNDEPMVSTTLPVGWALVYDAARQRHYYANTDTTGRTCSTWQHPLGPEKQLELEVQVQAWRAARLQSPHASQPQLSCALPDGWEERTDPQTRRTFYVDHKTKKTTWERPQPSVAAPLSVANVSSHVNGDGAMALPPPWEARVDPRTGRAFYVNHATKTTSWEPPAVASSGASSVTPTSLAAVRPPSGNAETGDDSDWVARVDPATGRTFYVNDKTRQTSWTRPGLAAQVLPPPWEARVDPRTGRAFYVNHATKTTSWERPML